MTKMACWQYKIFWQDWESISSKILTKDAIAPQCHCVQTDSLHTKRELDIHSVKMWTALQYGQRTHFNDFSIDWIEIIALNILQSRKKEKFWMCKHNLNVLFRRRNLSSNYHFISCRKKTCTVLYVYPLYIHTTSGILHAS